MNDNLEQLRSSPIIEFVLDIDCDLPIEFSLKDCKEAASKLFTKSYPKSRKQFEQQIVFDQSKHEGSEAAPSNPELSALQFLQEDKLQVVQVRKNGFSFNRLRPYTTLDDYLDVIETAWQDYCTLAEPIQILHIRVRYINRLLLPVSNGTCDLEGYLSSAPGLPGNNLLQLTGFISQRNAVDPATGNTVAIVQASQKIENNSLPVILDITTSAEKRHQPDWSWLKEQIMLQRELANLVFNESVTEKCLTLFQ